MTRPVITVQTDASLDEVLETMQRNQIRRVAGRGRGRLLAGIIAQADVALATRPNDVGELVREVSRSTGLSSH